MLVEGKVTLLKALLSLASSVYKAVLVLKSKEVNKVPVDEYGGFENVTSNPCPWSCSWYNAVRPVKFRACTSCQSRINFSNNKLEEKSTVWPLEPIKPLFIPKYFSLGKADIPSKWSLIQPVRLPPLFPPLSQSA